MTDYVLMIMLAASCLAMIIFYGRSKHPVKSALKGMSGGGLLLVLLHFFGGVSGFSLPLNLFNTAVSLALGVPGVVMIMGVNLL